MKKTGIFTLFLALAIFASAQLQQPVLFPALTNNIFAYSANTRTDVTGAIGSFQHHLIYKKTIDTAFTAGPVFSTNATTVWRTLDSLQPVTNYTVLAVVENNGVSDTSQPITFTTKTPPPALVPIVIAGIHTNASYQQTTVGFHVVAEGYLFTARVYYGTQQFPSNPITLTGTVDTFITLTTPNTGTYTNNRIFVQPVGTVPSNITYQFFQFNDYTVPGPSSADVTAISLVTPTGTIDSLYASASVSIGNTGSAVIIPRGINAQGYVDTMYGSFVITHDTVMHWGLHGLPNNTARSFRVTAVAPGGSDSAQTGPTFTGQVSAGTIGNWNTTFSTTNSANITVQVNSNGTTAPSIGQLWAEYPNAYGGTHTTDTASGIIGNVSKTLWLDSLKPGPAQNPVTLRYKNAAGLVTTSQIAVQVQTPVTGFVIPATWTLSSPTSSSLRVNNADCVPQNGDIGAAVVGVVRPSFSSVGDTVILASGISTHVILSMDVLNLTGSTVYFVQLLGRSGSGLLSGNGIEKSAMTNIPIPAVLSDCVIDSFRSSTAYYHIEGNGNGTVTDYTRQLFHGVSAITSPYTSSVGTGNIHYAYSYSDLLSGIEYNIFNKLSGPNNSNPVTLVKYFTMITTGIETVKPETIDPNTFVTVYDELGRMVTSGLFKTIHHNVRESGYRGIYFVRAASGSALKYGMLDN